jgi:hypothetical protein
MWFFDGEIPHAVAARRRWRRCVRSVDWNLWIAADVADAVSGEVFEMRRRWWEQLWQPSFICARCRALADSEDGAGISAGIAVPVGNGESSGARGGEKLPAIHAQESTTRSATCVQWGSIQLSGCGRS